MHWIQDLVSLIIAASMAYHVLAMYEVTRFARGLRTPLGSSFRPPVTLLKPLVLWDNQTRENLASFCHQRYPAYQMLVGIPAHLDVETLVAELTPLADGTTLQWAVCDQQIAVNPKLNQVLQLMPLAQHEILVLSDADMRVTPDYLARIVAPLQEPDVGVVTALYSVREVPTLPAAVEALMINVDFAPSVLVARRLFGVRFAFGASIALRRDVLEAIGGFTALADYLADDFQIGHRAAEAGYRVVLAEYVVENRLLPIGFIDLYRHQLRWARTNRICRPTGWFFSLITHLSFWATTWLVLSGFSEAGWRLVGATLVFRVLEGQYVNARLNGLRRFWRVAWLMPLKDLFGLAMWVLSFTGNQVHWAGREYQVLRDGRMREAEPKAEHPVQG